MKLEHRGEVFRPCEGHVPHVLVAFQWTPLVVVTISVGYPLSQCPSLYCSLRQTRVFR